MHFQNIDFDIDIESFGSFDIDIGIDIEKKTLKNIDIEQKIHIVPSL